MAKARKKQLTREQFREIAALFGVLSDPTRLEIIHHLSSAEASVSELCHALGQKQANISKHLSGLFAAGIVSRQSRGTSSYYRLQNQAILGLCEIVCGHVEDYAERRLRSIRNRK